MISVRIERTSKRAEIYKYLIGIPLLGMQTHRFWEFQDSWAQEAPRRRNQD